MTYPIIQLKKDQDRRIQAGHSWIYSNEIDISVTPLKQFTAGELVLVSTNQGKKIGIAYINPQTLLCARLLTRHINEIIEIQFFQTRILNALKRRQRIFTTPYYRLVFGESDGLPGLIIDRYNDVLVGQINTAGMERFKDIITEALINILSPKHLLWRNDSSYRELEGLNLYTEIGYGEAKSHCIIEENNTLFNIPLIEGQKTGWFYDHRFSRQRISTYAQDKTILDVFSYVGGFGIQLAKHGARQVTCIDSSEKALNLIKENAKLNQLEDKIHTQHADAFKALETFKIEKNRFDIIIVDPPAFIKRKKDQAAGEQAYARLNQLAMELLAPEGILLSASCSMHLGRNELLNILRKSGLKANRFPIVLEQLHQAPDHPVHPTIEETDYLKGFILGV